MLAVMLMTAHRGLALAADVRAEGAFGLVTVRPAARSAMCCVLRAAGPPTDRIMVSVNALPVKTDGRILLFDSGLGPNAHGHCWRVSARQA